MEEVSFPYFMRHYIAALHALPLMSQARLEKIVQYYGGDMERAWKMLDSSVLLSVGYKTEQAEAVFVRKRTLDPDKVAGHLKKTGIHLLMRDDPTFPALFRHVYPAPFLIYILGNEKLLTAPVSIGIVGTRKITSYGRQVIDAFVPTLVKASCPIVSGLAFGVDAYVHRKVLESHGQTIGVLGSGLDVPSPVTNAHLAKEIVEHDGLLLSEFPLGKSPEPFHFPLRNRFIAALSHALLVVEAGEKSGALITAELAIEQGKEVFSVPGSIFSTYSKGTNSLLRKGEAYLTESPLEILQALGMAPDTAAASAALRLSPELTEFLEHFSFLPEEQEDIFARSHLSITTFQMQVTLLELEGVIKKVDGTRWVRRK